MGSISLDASPSSIPASGNIATPYCALSRSVLSASPNGCPRSCIISRTAASGTRMRWINSAGAKGAMKEASKEAGGKRLKSVWCRITEPISP